MKNRCKLAIVFFVALSVVGLYGTTGCSTFFNSGEEFQAEDDLELGGETDGLTVEQITVLNGVALGLANMASNSALTLVDVPLDYSVLNEAALSLSISKAFTGVNVDLCKDLEICSYYVTPDAAFMEILGKMDDILPNVVKEGALVMPIPVASIILAFAGAPVEFHVAFDDPTFVDLRMKIEDGLDLTEGIMQIIKAKLAESDIPENLVPLALEGLAMDAKFKNMEIQYLVSDGLILGAQFISFWDVNGEPTKCFVLPADASASMSKQLDIELEIGCEPDDGATNMCLDDCLNPSCQAFCVCEAICANPQVNGTVSDGQCVEGQVEVPLVTPESDCKCCLTPTCEMICSSDEVGGSLPVEGDCAEGLGLAPIPDTDCTCCVPCEGVCALAGGSVPDEGSCEEDTGLVENLEETGCDCCLPCQVICGAAGGIVKDEPCSGGTPIEFPIGGCTCCVPMPTP
jgi:hypothetical protein